MSLLKRFIANIQNENLFQKNDNVIIAVSGGVDSVVLGELCHQSGFNFEIAHCNFQLRGEESMRDEAFVQSLAEKYGTKVFIKKFDTNRYAEEHVLSIQVAARELRYDWFDELLNAKTNSDLVSTINNKHPTFLLTAHHANDNMETVLMNFFKGTGIKGLRGILPKQGKIIRPLLFAKKEEILAFAMENNLSFVEDSSNISDKYSRNYFRNQLIPSIKKVFPRAEDNVLESLERFRDIEILYQQQVEAHKKKLLEYKGSELHIPVLKLLQVQPLKTIVYEIIKEYGFTAHQTLEVVHLLQSDSGKYISSATHKIIKNRKWIIIAPHNTLTTSLVVINENDNEIEFQIGTLKIEKFNNNIYQPSNDNNIATLDAARIQFPLLLRKWKQGDYFYPLGMQKKKKLGKFFIDQKFSLTEKEKAWVIESDKRILWIVGKRIDDRCKVTAQTTVLLQIQFKEL